jgi:PAS domain S-box-containing protein
VKRDKSAILDALPIAVYRSTPDGRIVDANPAMVELFGHSDRDSLLGTPAQTLYADPAERERVMNRAEREGHLRGIETQLRRRDGRVFWGRLNTFVEREPDGRPRFYVGAIEDVTERRLAEDALWESEARSRMLLEQLPAVLWTTDADLRSTLSEGAALKTIGLRPNQLRGMKIAEYMGDTEEGLATVAAHQRALQGEVLSYRQDWGGRAFEAHVRPLYGEDRSIIGTLGMALDVTDRTRLEDSLRVGEERYRLLYEKERAGREQAERLRIATAVLGSTLDVREVLARILRELQGVVPYDSASIQELRGHLMVVIAGHGFADMDRILDLAFDVRGGDTPNATVFQTRRPLLLKNAPASFPVFRAEPYAGIRAKAWIGVPLLFGDRVIGMLTVDKDDPDFYAEEHVALAEAFAAPAAVALENARLYAAARQEIDERRQGREQR